MDKILLKRINRSLVDLGLSEAESHVYTALLGFGPSGVAALAKASGVKRTTTYSVLESLNRQGLVSQQLRGLKTEYVAASPERLEQIIQNKQVVLKSILPELAALNGLKASGSLIKYYDGLPAIKSVYESLLSSALPGDDYLIISDQSKFYAQDPVYFEQFTQRRSQLGVKLKLLLVDNPHAAQFKARERELQFSVRTLPKDSKISTNLVIVPTKVVIHQLVAPNFAVVIENESIVRLHQELFWIVWNSAL